ncbi:hypothetical protein BH11MYX3_BH11MYX3_09100 [soil metagenome]
MIRAAVGLALLAACASGTDSAKPANTSNAMNRSITPRSKLPSAILPLVPRHGVYVAGGGLVSPAWRVVLDLDAKTLYGGSASAANAPSFGPMEVESTKALSQRNQELLMGLANAAWGEPATQDAVSPTADYDEIFVVLEGDDTFYLQGFGPIRRPAAANAIVELRAAAGL